MNRFFTLFFSLILCVCSYAQSFTVDRGNNLKVYLPSGQKPVVNTAFGMLAGDFMSVFDAVLTPVSKEKKADIICKVDESLPREGFRISVSKGKLWIHGADSHGLAYGLLEVSRLIGVSPWVYWADCTPEKVSSFGIEDGYSDTQSPKVAYRGIFINDEDWGLNPWATKQEPGALTLRQGRIKGAIGPKVNEKIFQLLLRLRANYYWPAMHEVSQPFFTIPGNREMASKYGIYIGGSHCEPMACSVAVEWGLRGKGEYNYVTNRDNVLNFFRERVDEVKDQEILYTIGMRGVHDSGMLGVKTKEDKLKYLQMVIDDQRRILSEKINADVTKVPQVFIPYKEVLEIYENGLKVPDDVTLMWCDDNYGYIRHFPTTEERARKGGNGIYYHVSYWGRPHDYLWLGTFSPKLLYQQMGQAYERGIRNIWLLNVGDIKPAEYQIEEFMTLAWNAKEPNMRAFFAREFGEKDADEITRCMNEFYDLAEQRKPEHMGGTRTEESNRTYWDQLHPIDDWTKGDVAYRVARYQALSDAVEQLWGNIPEHKRDAFFQLVKYPVQGAAQMNFKLLCPERCVEAYDSIASLTRIYNKVCAGGKWDGIMDMHPRDLPVYSKVKPEQLPVYPDGPRWEDREIKDMRFVSDADSITLEVRLLPTHPVNKKLSFSIAVDGGKAEVREYQTYDRSEEWKQNVLHGYAVRMVTLPLDKSRREHQITFKPLDEGVVLKHILKK